MTASQSTTVDRPDALAAALAAVEQAEADLNAGLAEAARAQAQRALEMSRRCDDEHLQGRAQLVLARSFSRLGEHISHTHLAATEAYALLGASGDLPRQLMALNMRAIVQCSSGNIAQGIELLQAGLALAVGAPCKSARMSLLANLALYLANSGEPAEALHSMTEAHAIVHNDGAEPEKQAEMALRLAMLYSTIGNDLERAGRLEEAVRHHEAATRLLPPLDENPQRAPTFHGYLLLTLRTQVLVHTAQWPAARRSAANLLRLVRQPGIGAKARHEALETMAEFHRSRGRPGLALRYEQRYRRWVLTLGYPGLDVHRLDRIAALHAQLGQWEQALRYAKELVQQQRGKRSAAAILRSRLAANERAHARKHNEALQQRNHARRLAVIGRLVAQTHSALRDRVTHVQHLCRRALASPAAPDLSERMGQVSQAVDDANSLVSQLKLFCYRSAPEAAELALHEALVAAWQDLAQHRRTPVLQIDIGSHTPVRAWADEQRLGILLKVLLIELTQGQGVSRIRATSTGPGPSHGVTLHIDAVAPGTAHADTLSLGLTLCAEMAIEMNGSLHAETRAAVMHLRLQLPAEPAVREAPQPHASR